MFKVEENVELPQASSYKRGREKEELRKVLTELKNGQSVFVEHVLLSSASVDALVKELKEQYSDRTFIKKKALTPVKGIRIWSKFFDK